MSRSSCLHAPRPGGRWQLQAYDKLLVDRAKRHSANAFFSGVGGDNVFYLSNSARPLVDRYLMGGTLTDLRSTLLDICRSEEHTSELQSLMRISYAVFCLKKKTTHNSYRLLSCSLKNKHTNTRTSNQDTKYYEDPHL